MSEGLKVVAIEHSSRREFSFQWKRQEGHFSIDTAQLARSVKPGSPLMLLDILARRNSAQIEHLTLRVPVIGETLTDFSIRIDLTSQEFGPGTIKQFQTEGLSLGNDFEIFFRSRRMYHQIQATNKNHPLIVAAAYWYFASAYELASNPNSMIVMDEDALVASEDILARAMTQRLLADALSSYSISKAHWSEMIAKARRLDWKLAKLVRQNANSGNLEAAEVMNDHFKSKYKKLTPEGQRAVTKEYGISGDLLAANSRFLKGAVASVNTSSAPMAAAPAAQVPRRPSPASEAAPLPPGQ